MLFRIMESNDQTVFQAIVVKKSNRCRFTKCRRLKIIVRWSVDIMIDAFPLKCCI